MHAAGFALDNVLDGLTASAAAFKGKKSIRARTTPLDQVKKETEGLSVFLVDLNQCRGKGLEIRPIDAMIKVFMDGMEVPAENLIDERGQGFRYILDGSLG